MAGQIVNSQSRAIIIDIDHRAGDHLRMRNTTLQFAAGRQRTQFVLHPSHKWDYLRRPALPIFSARSSRADFGHSAAAAAAAHVRTCSSMLAYTLCYRHNVARIYCPARRPTDKKRCTCWPDCLTQPITITINLWSSVCVCVCGWSIIFRAPCCRVEYNIYYIVRTDSTTAVGVFVRSIKFTVKPILSENWIRWKFVLRLVGNCNSVIYNLSCILIKCGYTLSTILKFCIWTHSKLYKYIYKKKI